jgi:hypothetical protein
LGGSCNGSNLVGIKFRWSAVGAVGGSTNWFESNSRSKSLINVVGSQSRRGRFPFINELGSRRIISCNRTGVDRSTVTCW